MDWWQAFREWFLELGDQYNVNPYIFGSIYIGAIPFFLICLHWTIKNIRNGRPIVLPLMLTGLCFISAYLYLIVVGRNIRSWVYILIGVMIIYGVYSTFKKIMDSKQNKSRVE